MERNAHDSEDNKDDKKPARSPMHVPLGGMAREGGFLGAEKKAEKPKAEDPLVPLREAVMSHVSEFEQQQTIVGRTEYDRRSRAEDEEDEDEDDDTAGTVVRSTRAAQAKAEVNAESETPEPEALSDFETSILVPPLPEVSNSEDGRTPPPPFRPVARPLTTPPSGRRFGAAGGGRPPIPPSRPSFERSPEPEPEPSRHESAMNAAEDESHAYHEAWSRAAEAAETTATSTEPPAAERHEGPRFLHSQEYTMLQRERAGDFITSVVLGWYLAHRALNKHNEQNQRDFKAVRSEAFRQDQAHNELRDEFNRYAADKANQEALEKRQQALKRTPETPGPATPEQIAAIQQQVEAAANQSKVHIEQDAWKRYVMVNGKLEQSAIEYGKAFREEQRAEQAGNHFGLPDQGGGPVRQGGPMFGQTPMLGSGQADPRFQLPSSDYPIDEQHLLQASYSSPILDAAKNPWVWAGVGILILAFFTAAFV